jgi:hypothetical protein
MQLKSQYNMKSFTHVSLWSCTQHIVNFTCGYLLYCIVYIGKFSWLEKDRSRKHPDEDWPWVTLGADEWKRLLKRTIMFNLM